MFRLRFWALLLSLSVLTVGLGEARLAWLRARELRLNPPIIAFRPPQEAVKHQNMARVAREDRFIGRMSPSAPRRGR